MKRFLSALLSSVLLASSVLTPAAEANFWAERQKNIQRSRTDNSAQLVGLPSGFSSNEIGGTGDLLRQLPSLNKSLGTFSPPSSVYAKFKLPASISPFIESIPLNAGTVKELSINTPDSPLVVLIQDVHMNEEAQRNIATILLSLNGKSSLLSAAGRLLVGVEGAFTSFDFQRFRSFEDKKLVKDVADYFLKENRFAAPSYVGVTADPLSMQFVGIDEETHYWANVEAYRSSQSAKASVQSDLANAERALQEEKNKTLNAELRKFDGEKRGQQKGEIGLGDYLSYVVRSSDQWDAASGENESHELVVDRFLSAYEIEKSLDFQRVERERSRVVETLAPQLRKSEINQLVTEGLAYQSGRISFADYYRGIKALIDAHGISLSSAPAFDAYIRYVLLADGIKAEELMPAIQRMETRLLNGLCRTEKEKNLMAQSRALYLTGKLLDFALTPEEWIEYKKTPDRSFAIERKKLLSFEKFYEEADIRSEKMVADLVAAHTHPDVNRSAAVLLTGGFHTPQLTRLLKEKGYSYAVVQPKITKIENATGTEYLSIFTREKTPLDKLFEGEKLFLAPYQLEDGAHEKADQMPDDILNAVLMGLHTQNNGRQTITFPDGKALDFEASNRAPENNEMVIRIPEDPPVIIGPSTNRGNATLYNSFHPIALIVALAYPVVVVLIVAIAVSMLIYSMVIKTDVLRNGWIKYEIRRLFLILSQHVMGLRGKILETKSEIVNRLVARDDVAKFKIADLRNRLLHEIRKNPAVQDKFYEFQKLIDFLRDSHFQSGHFGPQAAYDRFEHSLEVAYVALRAGSKKYEDAKSIRNFFLAALLHDYDPGRTQPNQGAVVRRTLGFLLGNEAHEFDVGEKNEMPMDRDEKLAELLSRSGVDKVSLNNIALLIYNTDFWSRANPNATPIDTMMRKSAEIQKKEPGTRTELDDQIELLRTIDRAAAMLMLSPREAQERIDGLIAQALGGAPKNMLRAAHAPLLDVRFWWWFEQEVDASKSDELFRLLDDPEDTTIQEEANRLRKNFNANREYFQNRAEADIQNDLLRLQGDADTSGHRVKGKIELATRWDSSEKTLGDFRDVVERVAKKSGISLVQTTEQNGVESGVKIIVDPHLGWRPELLRWVVQAIRTLFGGSRFAESLPAAPPQFETLDPSLANEVDREHITGRENITRLLARDLQIQDSKGNPPASLRRFVDAAIDNGSLVLYRPGDMLIDERTPNYLLILDGEAQIVAMDYMRGSAVPEINGPMIGRGNGIGTWAISSQRVPTADIRARTPVIAFRLAPEEFFRYMKETVPSKTISKEKENPTPVNLTPIEVHYLRSLDVIRTYDKGTPDLYLIQENHVLVDNMAARLRRIGVNRFFQFLYRCIDRFSSSLPPALPQGETETSLAELIEKLRKGAVIVRRPGTESSPETWEVVPHSLQHAIVNTVNMRRMLESNFLRNPSPPETLTNHRHGPLNSAEAMAMYRNTRQLNPDPGSDKENPSYTLGPTNIYFLKMTQRYMMDNTDPIPAKLVAVLRTANDSEVEKDLPFKLPVNGVLDFNALPMVLGEGEKVERYRLISLDETLRVYELDVLGGYREDLLNRNADLSLSELVNDLRSSLGFDISSDEASTIMERIDSTDVDLQSIASVHHTDLSADFRAELISLVKGWATLKNLRRIKTIAGKKGEGDWREFDSLLSLYVEFEVHRQSLMRKEAGDDTNRNGQNGKLLTYLESFLKTTNFTTKWALDVRAAFGVLWKNRVNGQWNENLNDYSLAERDYRAEKFFLSGSPKKLSETHVVGVTRKALALHAPDFQQPTLRGYNRDPILIPDVHEVVYGLEQLLVSLNVIDATTFLLDRNHMRGRTLILQGDIINRVVGPNGYEALRRIQDLFEQVQAYNKEQRELGTSQNQIEMRMLMGNHELDMMKWNETEMQTNFPDFGKRTLAILVRQQLLEMAKEGLMVGAHYLGNRDYAYDKSDGAVLVHAGITDGMWGEFQKENKENKDRYENNGAGFVDYVNDHFLAALGLEKDVEGNIDSSGAISLENWKPNFSHAIFYKSSERGGKDGHPFSGVFNADMGYRQSDLRKTLEKLKILDEKGAFLPGMTPELAEKIYAEATGGFIVIVGHNFSDELDGEKKGGVRNANVGEFVARKTLISDNGVGQVLVMKVALQNQLVALVRQGGKFDLASPEAEVNRYLPDEKEWETAVSVVNKVNSHAEQLLREMLLRPENPFVSSDIKAGAGTGGLLLSLRYIFINLLHLPSGFYDKFLGPLLENVGVAVLWYSLTSYGINSPTAIVLAWGIFFALHAIEWLGQVGFWAWSRYVQKNPAAPRAPPLPINVFFSFALSGIAVALFGSFPFSSLLSSHSGSYWIIATLVHLLINNAAPSLTRFVRGNLSRGKLMPSVEDARLARGLVAMAQGKEENSNTSTKELLNTLFVTPSLELNNEFLPSAAGVSPFVVALRQRDLSSLETAVRMAAREAGFNLGMTVDERAKWIQELALMGINPKMLTVDETELVKDVDVVNVVLDGTLASREADKKKLNAILGTVEAAARQRGRPIKVRVFVGTMQADVRAFKIISGFQDGEHISFEPRPDGSVRKDGALVLDGFVGSDVSKLKRSAFFIGMKSVTHFALSTGDNDDVLQSLTVAFINDALEVRAFEGPMLRNIDTIARVLGSGA